MSVARNNVVDFLAGTDIIGHLSLPLTPSRQAAIANFELRTGLTIQAAALDALDDIIFDTGGEVVVFGGASCGELTSGYPQSSAKSNERSCTALHDCAIPPSDAPAKASGPTKPQKNSPSAPDVPCAPPLMSLQATASHLADQSASSSQKSANGHFD